MNYDLTAKQYNERYCKGKKGHNRRQTEKIPNEPTKLYMALPEYERMRLASSYRTFMDYLVVHIRK